MGGPKQDPQGKQQAPAKQPPADDKAKTPQKQPKDDPLKLSQYGTRCTAALALIVEEYSALQARMLEMGEAYHDGFDGMQATLDKVKARQQLTADIIFNVFSLALGGFGAPLKAAFICAAKDNAAIGEGLKNVAVDLAKLGVKSAAAPSPLSVKGLSSPRTFKAEIVKRVLLEQSYLAGIVRTAAENPPDQLAPDPLTIVRNQMKAAGTAFSAFPQVDAATLRKQYEAKLWREWIRLYGSSLVPNMGYSSMINPYRKESNLAKEILERVQNPEYCDPPISEAEAKQLAGL